MSGDHKSPGDVSLIVRDESSFSEQTAVANIIGLEEAEAMSAVDLIQRVSVRPLELKSISRNSAASQPKSETRTAKKEIEIKVTVADVKPLLKFLENNGRFVFESHQLDVYYSPKHRDFLATSPKVKEWLRWREASGEQTINYKNWSYDDKGRSSHCDELEKTVKDMSEVQLALANNNFESIVTVNKQRRTHTYQNYEIAFDLVEGLGDFIEVEYIGEDTSVVPQEVAAEMMAFLQRVGCQKIERNYFGYPYLLLFQDRIAQKED